jgi:competence protein ComEC
LTVNKSEGDKSSLDYQNIWIIKGQISPIKGPSNPGGFNYKAYLKSIKINYQTNIDKNDISRAESTDFSLLKYNAFLLKKLDESRLNPQTIAILKTILLGERSSLNASTRDEFAKAGVVHLFAISGLHVGLLMLFFQTLFRPLVSLPRGKLWQNIAVLACLWCYAFLVGGSASVIRAVTLFSAYQIGQNSGRKLPTASLVLLSMGILLFIRPSFIQQLGFQMSYLAVFGILFLSPLFKINFKHRALGWFWQLTIVSLSTQIAVAPLSIFHFHQFPTLFLLSNWVILPFMGAFLYVSLTALLWLLISPLPLWLMWLVDNAVTSMLRFVQWVAEKENWILDHIYYTPLSLLLIYFNLICASFYGHSKKNLWLYGTMISSMYLYLNIKRIPTQQLWIAHQYKQTILVSLANQKLTFYF